MLVSEAEGGVVIVYDATTFKELGRVEVVARRSESSRRPTASAGEFVALPSDGKVACIDLATMKVTATLATGNQPDGVAWVEGK